MHSTVDLDALLGQQEPHATFHDAELPSIRVDYQERELVAEWLLCVGDPGATEKADRERRRHGRLTLSGLAFWAIEPPGATGTSAGPLWLTGDGPLSDAPSAMAGELARRLPADVAAWYWYFSEIPKIVQDAARSFQCLGVRVHMREQRPCREQAFSTSPRTPICDYTAPLTSTPSPGSSTIGLDRR